MVLKKYKVRNKFKEDIEPEEIFMDSKRLKESPDSEREKLERPIKEIVLKIFFVFIIVLLVILVGKTFHLQIIKGSYWRELADENRIRSYPIEPLRGIIYDRNKIPLAINVPKLDLVVIPADLTNINELADRLSQLLDKDKVEIEEKIRENINLSYPIIIAEDIEREKALLLESEFADISAISIRKDSRRQYENGPVFAHVLGYLGKVNKEEVSEKGYFLDDYIGRDGLERVYEDELRGTYGQELVEIDNIGRTQKVLATKEPIAGQDIVLSIDKSLQEKIYQSMRGRKGAAVALNPQNGKILALMSSPNFDNNEFIKGLSPESFDKVIQDKNEPFLNRVIAGQYPSGSTIKPLIAAAALEEGIISPDKQLNCPGQLTLKDKYNPNIFWTFPDWKAHGIVNMNKAIAESCNVYFYTIGGGYGDIEGLGIEKIAKYLNLFGWGQTLGIDLPGEMAGLVPSPLWKEETKDEEWYIGDTYNVSIGQGDISITPLQLAIATAAIANNGKVFQPQLTENSEPNIIRQGFIDNDFLEVVKRGMREAVISGSARALYDLPVKAAGKTGTAQVSKTKAPHSWFTVFAPYENPEIVLIILIENGGEGSEVALPVAKEVLGWWFSEP